jgi:hypothetical protein
MFSHNPVDSAVYTTNSPEKAGVSRINVDVDKCDVLRGLFQQIFRGVDKQVVANVSIAGKAENTN